MDSDSDFIDHFLSFTLDKSDTSSLIQIDSTPASGHPSLSGLNVKANARYVIITKDNRAVEVIKHYNIKVYLLPFIL